MATSVQRIVPLSASSSPLAFRPFGQVVFPSLDGAPFGSDDAQLRLSAGTPRFYIMRLEDRPLLFRNITHHASVTQCLGSVGALPWYIGVAKASILDENDEKVDQTKGTVKSPAGHYYIPPSPEDIQVFKVEGSAFLKFEVGTWHSGPYFKEKTMDFYNLELSDTNVVDHTTHSFNDLTFVIDD